MCSLLLTCGFLCSRSECSVTAFNESLQVVYTQCTRFLLWFWVITLVCGLLLTVLTTNTMTPSTLVMRSRLRELCRILLQICVLRRVIDRMNYLQRTTYKRIVSKEWLRQCAVARSFFVHDESMCESSFANGSRKFFKNQWRITGGKKIIVLQSNSNVIELQSQVIEMRDEELTSLTTFVEKEMKSVQKVVQEETNTFLFLL